MTTTIKLKNQRGTLLGPLRTTDSPAAAIGDFFSDLETTLGLLDAIDLSRIRAILEKYTGGSSTVNGLGMARAGDAADAGRAAGRKVAAEISHNQSVGD